MKKLLALGLLAISALPVSAFAFPSPAEMRANFAACTDADTTFMSRYGQYVVAFDQYEATDICNRTAFPGSSQRTELAWCSLPGQGYVYAGYFCQEVNNGDSPVSRD